MPSGTPPEPPSPWRYERELCPIAIGDPRRLEETLELWIEAYCRPA